MNWKFYRAEMPQEKKNCILESQALLDLGFVPIPLAKILMPVSLITNSTMGTGLELYVSCSGSGCKKSWSEPTAGKEDSSWGWSSDPAGLVISRENKKISAGLTYH